MITLIVDSDLPAQHQRRGGGGEGEGRGQQAGVSRPGLITLLLFFVCLVLL